MVAVCLWLWCSPIQAGTQFYHWDVAGRGEWGSDPIHGTGLIDFSARGQFSLFYDPDSGGVRSMSLEVNGPAGGMWSPVQESISVTSIGFSANDGVDGIDVTLQGLLGPTNAQGLPLSLAGLTDVTGTEQGNYHQQLVYFGFSSAAAAVPEPAGWVMLATAVGLGLVVFWSTRRDHEGSDR
jgi:hypothetical protein